MGSDPVSLFRCKQCRARMFERDCPGHLQRHGVNAPKLTPTQVLTHFERGPADAAAHPGANVKPLYYQTKGRKKTVAGDDERDPDEDLN